MMRAKRPRATTGRARGMSEDLAEDHLMHMDPSLMTERQQLAFLLRKTAQEQSGAESPAISGESSGDEAQMRPPRKKTTKKRIQRPASNGASKTSPRSSRNNLTADRRALSPSSTAMSRPFPTGKPSNYAKISSDVSPTLVWMRLPLGLITVNNDGTGRQPDDTGEDDYIQRERHQQQIERQKQDESLDQLHVAVKRLGDMSLSISTELESQNAMLDDLNEDTDKAQDALQAVTKKTKELIQQSGGMKNFVVIIVLVFILLILTSVARKLIPFGNRVLVKRFEAVAKTATGIYLPDADVKQNEGEVVAVGPGLRTSKGDLVAPQAAVGDKVLLPEYGGNIVKLGGQEFHLYRDDDLLGKLD
ncbi:hypothetical protein ATCC90586_007139 [Pythium insidiosum]|nr:hypothetical protein ATCC90586_007139 [Pythium insidiosum]